MASSVVGQFRSRLLRFAGLDPPTMASASPALPARPTMVSIAKPASHPAGRRGRGMLRIQILLRVDNVRLQGAHVGGDLRFRGIPVLAAELPADLIS